MIRSLLSSFFKIKFKCQDQACLAFARTDWFNLRYCFYIVIKSQSTYLKYHAPIFVGLIFIIDYDYGYDCNFFLKKISTQNSLFLRKLIIEKMFKIKKFNGNQRRN